MNTAVELTYLVAALLFIGGLRMLNSPTTARNGNLASALGMLLAIIATLLSRAIIGYHWIVLGLAAGSTVGVLVARRVPLTAMPELVALLNGFGGMASALVASETLYRFSPLDRFTATSADLSVLIGGVTFAGSLVAWAKLKEVLSGRPTLFAGQKAINGVLLVAGLVLVGWSAVQPADARQIVVWLLVLALLLGVLAVLPIGGADMPVVISLLNSLSGMAACATGFVLRSSILIVAGALVGASGIILTRLMCRSMNRSLVNVLFSGFGSAAPTASAGAPRGPAKTISAEEAWSLLEAARSVVIVPGYGLAVAQAQHVARELADLLEARGVEVRFAIHPVAGRMPGHMNVLLAEANVDYDRLADMDAINPAMATVDVCLVVGANDVVNPAAREDKSSPLYGMPIIEADRARAVLVLKRSLGAGFAGVDNTLFFKDNTRLLLGDAKASLQALVSEFKTV